MDQPSPNPIVAENALRGVPFWNTRTTATIGADDTETRVKGYASATSVAVGESIDFHVNVVRPEPYQITIYRVGYYAGTGARRMTGSPVLTRVYQPAPTIDPVTGTTSCAWSVSWSLPIPEEWTSGLYIAEFSTIASDEPAWTNYTPFVVRADNQASDLCIVIPFSTYQAYNLWPQDYVASKNLYFGYDPDGRFVSGSRAAKVSFDRPYGTDGLPLDLDFDRHAIAWIEEQGYAATYVSDLDLHSGDVDLTRYAGVIFSGHDEYWTAEKRNAVEKALAGGTSLAFLNANALYWQVRLDPSDTGRADRVVVCYKYAGDPDTRPGMATIRWRDPAPGANCAEQALLGVQYRAVVREPAPLVATNTDHWFWAGTGIREKDEIPAIIAGEADDVDPRYPLPTGMTQTLLSASPYVALNSSRLVQNTSVCEAPDGTLVFVAGTYDWVYGLSRAAERDERLRRATANLFDRMIDSRVRSAQRP